MLLLMSIFHVQNAGYDIPAWSGGGLFIDSYARFISSFNGVSYAGLCCTDGAVLISSYTGK